MPIADIIAIVTAISLLVGGVGAAIVNIIVALRQTKQLEAVGVAVGEINTKAAVIEGHVNSAATAARARIEELTKTIADLTASLAAHRETAALLAQSVATATKPKD